MKIEFEFTRLGKVVAMIPIGSGLILAGLLAQSPAFTVAGIILLGAAMLSLWMLRPGCQGEVRWRGTEDDEISIGTCQDCDRWMIRIRDQIVAHGRGYTAFRAAVEEIAASHQNYLPHLAARLRKLLDTLEESRKAEVESDG